jgi:hypothetical protein
MKKVHFTPKELRLAKKLHAAALKAIRTDEGYNDGTDWNSYGRRIHTGMRAIAREVIKREAGR